MPQPQTCARYDLSQGTVVARKSYRDDPRALSVLVVDDERSIADTLAQILTLSGFQTVACYSGFDAIERAKNQVFDVLLTDVVMPGMNGIETSREVSKILPHCTVILTSGNQATAQLLEGAKAFGEKFEIFAKPVHPLVIIERLRAIKAK